MIEAGIHAALKSALQNNDSDTKVLAVRRGTHLPAIVYNTITGNIDQTLSGHDALEIARIQVDCYHSSYQKVKELEQLVRSALHNQTGELGGQPCQRVVMESRRDGFDNSADIFRSILQFAITL